MPRLAYLADAADTQMLIWGDETVLRDLAATLRQAARSGEGISLRDPSGTPEVAIEIAESGCGLSQLSGTRFRWRVRRLDLDRFAELVSVVSKSVTPCHHYLDDAEGGGVTIKVSKGEYPDDFRP